MKLQIGMDSMLKLLREFINQTGFAVRWLYNISKPNLFLNNQAENGSLTLKTTTWATNI
jgi:hypothetical protein